MRNMSSRSRDYFYIKGEVNLKLLSNLITFIDGYLANYLDDPEPYRVKIRAGALGKEIAREWKSIEKSLLKIAYTVRRIPKVKFYLNLSLFTRITSIIFLIVAIVVAFTVIFTGHHTYYTIYLLALSLFLSSLTTIYTQVYIRKMNEEIERYFNQHSEKYRFIRENLRNFNQKLINSYRFYIAKRGLDPKKNSLALYNTFYSGIEIMKKPGLLSKKYKVIVRI